MNERKKDRGKNIGEKLEFEKKKSYEKRARKREKIKVYSLHRFNAVEQSGFSYK